MSTAHSMDRRHFLGTATLGLGTAAWAATWTAPAASPQPVWGLQPSKMHLGLVTYNLGKDWDLPTLLKNCQATQFEGVELRTTHAHGVEVTLTPLERAEVKRRFQDSPVQLVSLGSAFDYHTPDAAKLRRDLEATREYLRLAHDVGAAAIKVRPNGLPPGVPREKTLAQIGQSLLELGIYGASLGVAVRLEVHGPETSLIPHLKTILDTANHPNVGACWNSNATDLAGDGFERNFDSIQDKIQVLHITEICSPNYPYRRLFARLNARGFAGFCLAEIAESTDAIRLMKYYRALWLALQQA